MGASSGGHIRSLFFEAGIVLFLRAMEFCRLTNGVMRIFTRPPSAQPNMVALSADGTKSTICSFKVLT